jgi:hypothetical protein
VNVFIINHSERVIFLHQMQPVKYKTQEQAIVEDTGLKSISTLDV